MIYSFEGIGPETLDLVPLAARRALDHAGAKISLLAWRKASLEGRRALVQAGAAEALDRTVILEWLTRANIVWTTITPAETASANHIPAAVRAELGEHILPETWAALSPLDRYALSKVAKKPRGDRTMRAFTEMALVPEPRAAGVSSHLSHRGEVHMIDVGKKVKTVRRAVARATVSMRPETAERIRTGRAAKGEVLSTARIAGIQAAKRTPELIPLCHAVALTKVEIDIVVGERAVTITSTAEAHDRTGVEMEAMVAVSAAALTIYDMMKGTDRSMSFEVVLQRKEGGKSGIWLRDT